MSKIIETRSIIEAIYYILFKLGKTDKLKLLKLVYLADKYHLIYYGRTITNDDYYAMKHGPIASTVMDVLEFDEFSLSEEEYEYASSLFKKVDEHDLKPNEGVEIVLDMLSETDKEALNYVIEKFGSWPSLKLREYAHQYPEWYQYKELFEKSRIKRERIETEELLSIIDENFPVSVEHLEESRKIVTGDF